MVSFPISVKSITHHDSYCSNFIFLLPNDNNPLLTSILALSSHHYQIPLNLHYNKLSLVLYPYYTKTCTCTMYNPIFFCNVLVKTFAATVGKYFSWFQTDCVSPAPFPVTTLCGESGGRFLSAGIIYAPCDSMFYKINRQKKIVLVVFLRPHSMTVYCMIWISINRPQLPVNILIITSPWELYFLTYISEGGIIISTNR